MAQVSDPVIARFTFLPDRAPEFLDEGRLVTQIECETIDEVIAYTEEFRNALEDVTAIVNGQVVVLSES